jgi:hypothetical protein
MYAGILIESNVAVVREKYIHSCPAQGKSNHIA